MLWSLNIVGSNLVRCSGLSPRIVIDTKCRHVGQLVEHALLICIKGLPTSKRHECLPNVEAEAKIRVGQNVLIADSRTSIPRCICVKWVPFLNGWHFEEFQECKADGNCENYNHVKELYLRPVHIRIDVEQKHHIKARNELGAKLDRTTRPNENEKEEFQEVCVGKVHIVDMTSVRLWEHHLCPEEIA